MTDEERIAKRKASQKERDRRYKERNRETVAARASKWIKTTEKGIAARKKAVSRCCAASCEELRDWYVRKAIIQHSDLKGHEIPDELVELKRDVIMLKRLMRSVKG